MHLSPMNLDELHSKLEITHELNWDAILEKIVLVAVAYFCLGTELRFMATKDSDKRDDHLCESDLWHSKSLRIACKFLPAQQNCPLVDHIIASYNKHHLVRKQKESQRSNLEQKAQQLAVKREKTKSTHHLNLTIKDSTFEKRRKSSKKNGSLNRSMRPRAQT